MSVRARLLLILAFVALVPVAVSGYMALGVHQRAYESKLEEAQRRTAEYGASLARAFVEESVAGLSLLAAETIPWSRLTAEERTGALWVIYKHRADVAAVTLLDHDGRGVGPSAFWDGQVDEPRFAGHPATSLPALQGFAGAIPFEAARAAREAVIGAPFVPQDGGSPLLPLAVGVESPTLGSRWVVAVALSLRSLCSEIAALRRSDELDVQLVVGELQICPGSGRTDIVAASQGRGSELLRLGPPGPRQRLAAVARLPNGWMVVAEQPSSVAFRSSRVIRAQTIYWIGIGLAIALVAGLILSRSVTRPVALLSQAARALARGEYGYRIGAALDDKDELGRLARAFDHMGTEVERRDAEIRAFNQELQARVDARTRELRDAQAQLLQSQKLAAVNTLGAGVAHEINNPLTTVIGFAQLIQMNADKAGDQKLAKMIATVESEAQRIRKTVERLRDLSESYAGESFVACDLAALLEQALSQVAPPAELSIAREYSSTAPPVQGNAAQLTEVFVQILKNAVTATRSSAQRKLRLSVSCPEPGLARVDITDSGRGIAPELIDKVFDPFFTTKDEWRGEGLGLTVAHRIVEEHHGKIRVVSQVGQGATFSVLLPAGPSGTHLT